VLVCGSQPYVPCVFEIRIVSTQQSQTKLDLVLDDNLVLPC
jgi:hypothetical protein